MTLLLFVLENWLAACGRNALFLVAIILLRQIFKQSLSPKRIYRIWLLAALRLLYPLAFLPVQFNWPLRVAAYLRQEPNFRQAQALLAGTGFSAADPIFVAFLRLLWLTGAIVLAAFFFTRNLRLNRWLRRERKLCLKYSSKLPLYTHEQIQGAVIRGWAKHKEIYINPALAAEPEELSLALLHEYGHAANRDDSVLYVKLLLLCLYWYHPLVWIAAWISAEDSEAAADQWALERSGLAQRKNYAELLVKQAGERPAGRMPLQAAGLSFSRDYRSVRRRIRRMYRGGSGKRPALLLAFLLLLFVAADFSGSDKSSEYGIRFQPTAVKQVQLLPEPSMTIVSDGEAQLPPEPAMTTTSKSPISP